MTLKTLVEIAGSSVALILGSYALLSFGKIQSPRRSTNG